MKWGVDKSGSNPQTYMVKELGRFDPYNPISYIFCYKYVMFCSSKIRIKLTYLIQNIITYNGWVYVKYLTTNFNNTRNFIRYFTYTLLYLVKNYD